MRRKILIISPDCPFPANHGGRVDVYRRLKTLKKFDFEVDFVFTTYEYPNELILNEIRNYADNIFWVQRSKNILNLVGAKPFQVTSRSNLKKVHLTKEYDWAILEGEYVGDILENPMLSVRNIAIRVNNIESKYFYRLFLSTLWKRESLYYLADSIRFYNYSKKIFKKSNCLLFVSRDEMNLLSKNDFKKDIKYLQLLSHYDVKEFKTNSSSSRNVLFVGSLFMPNNLEGLQWYLDNVHNVILKSIPDYQLTIVGSTNNQEIATLSRLKEYKNVDLVVNAESLDDFYNSSSVFINPMLNGAGIKVKTINAIQNGLPVVTTDVGNEGIGFKHGVDILVSNDSKQFANHVIDLLENIKKAENLVSNAQKYLIGNDHEKILFDILSNN